MTMATLDMARQPSALHFSAGLEPLKPDSQTLGFLDLPVEIRIDIYRYLFDAAEIMVNGPPFSKDPVPSVICKGGFQRKILDTCWTIRNEAAAYLFAATTLKISQPLDEACPIPPYYLYNIPRLVVTDAKAFSKEQFKADRLPGLQVLELRNITIWCLYHPEEFLLNSEFGDETMLGVTSYNINRISPSLTRLIGEKDRTYKIHLFCQFVVSSDSHETIVSYPSNADELQLTPYTARID